MPPEHLQTHVSSKHEIQRLHDTVEFIVSGRRLKSLDSMIEFREYKGTRVSDRRNTGEEGVYVSRMWTLRPDQGVDVSTFRI